MKYINLNQLVLLSIATFVAIGFQVAQAGDRDETWLTPYKSDPKLSTPMTLIQRQRYIKSND